LNSIPGEVAQAMIQALSGSGNQPIGEPPRAIQTSAVSPAPTLGQPAGTSAQAASPPDARRPVGVRGSWFLFIAGGMACLGFPALVVVWLIVRAVNKSRR